MGYHQEIGRAGQPAECVLLYDPSDLNTWCHVMRIAIGNEDTEDAGDVPDHLGGKLAALDDIDEYCLDDRDPSGGMCRHADLADHFGQTWPPDRICEDACDICLGDSE